jgi:hypothetical protein
VGALALERSWQDVIVAIFTIISSSPIANGSLHHNEKHQKQGNMTDFLDEYSYDNYYKTDSVKVCPYTLKFECIDCHKRQHSN